MPPRPFVNDGLWRCLCPGFTPNIVAHGPTHRAAGLSRRNRWQKDGITPASRQSRAYNASNTSFAANDSFFSQPGTVDAGFRPFTEQYRQPLSRTSPHGALTQLPTHILYERLRLEGSKGSFKEVMSICRILVKDRGEQANKEMYNAILHSFVSPDNGTAGKVRKVLEEMGFWNDTDAYASLGTWPRIDLDARGCECILEVLAVHPDYLLRSEILEYMKSRWFSVSDRGRNFIVAGMLRERNFEHALELLEEMVRNKARVESWLFDKAMWMLLEFGEPEEAFHVLSLKERMQRKDDTIGTVNSNDALWGALLDAAAQRQLYDAANMVWTNQVQPGYLKPGTGTCISILSLAARYGDVQLATDVFRLLTERGTALTTHHYELLISAYLSGDDLSAALSVLLIMVDAKLKVDAGTCQPLFLYLSAAGFDSANRPMQAFDLLQNFEAAGRKVPTAAVNACMQASIALQHLEEAIEIYKALHSVSHAGPDTNTFNILFRGCHLTANKELAMFFANEMIQLGLKPDRMTYDRLILVCLQAGDLEDALLYYEELVSAGAAASAKGLTKPRKKTWELLVLQCVAKGDERAVALLKDYKNHIEEPRKSVERAVVDRFDFDSVPRRVGKEQLPAQKSATSVVEDRHVRPAREGEKPPGSGAEATPEAAGGADPRRSTDGEDLDGLAQLMKTSKSTKPY